MWRRDLRRLVSIVVAVAAGAAVASVVPSEVQAAPWTEPITSLSGGFALAEDGWMSADGRFALMTNRADYRVRILDRASGALLLPNVPVVGTTNVPSNASAVVLNVTGTGANADGYVTVWPCGAPQPNASNLNLVAGGTTPNLVITRIGTDGKVCVFTDRGTHLIADISGYFPAGSSFVSVSAAA